MDFSRSLGREINIIASIIIVVALVMFFVGIMVGSAVAPTVDAQVVCEETTIVPDERPKFITLMCDEDPTIDRCND